MYETIYVPVDNSPHSNRAIDTALALGRRFDSKLVGCHVYAARMHDYRFKQMEYTLPEEYLVEQELSRQRKIHDSLITMGLELISDCYLEEMDGRCREAGLEFERKMMDGKHSIELVKDIEASDYDLVVLGAVGIGKTKDTQVGAVCSKVAQTCFRDTWVVRHVPKADEPERDTILVGVDGSPKSFGALMAAVDLAKRFDKKLEVVGVYDPYLHYAVFKGIVGVLTERASKVFRFEEQNQLHEEIIDTGLAQIYQSHLNVAERMAEEAGVEVTKTLLDGKAFQKILDHARKIEPWVLVVGRVGIHSDDDDEGLGSNTENLLRLAPCDVLLTTSDVVPELDVKAEESIHWTPEAESRMVRVPDAVRGIARTAILRLAIEQGHSVVSSDLVTEAMERFMPKRTAEANVKLAEALVLDKATRDGTAVAICTECGLAARSAEPTRCTVCGNTEFERITPDMVARIIEDEGGVEEETTYDGRKIRWTQESRKALRAIEDRYQRRRAKARIEKAARGNKMDPITLEFAQRFIEEETGVLYTPSAEYLEAKERRADGAPEGGNSAPVDAEGSGSEEAPEASTAAPEVARDDAGTVLRSTFSWTDDAVARLLRVPAGFMRDATQERVEGLAGDRGTEAIDLALVEEGIELGKKLMSEMLGMTASSPATSSEPAPSDGNGAAEGATAEAAACPVDEAEEASGCPMHRATERGDADAVKEVLKSHPLTEVSVMSEMERRRREIVETVDEASDEG